MLERPIIEPPGRRWIYNGGATALLARLIEKGTGRQLHEFAREVLFEPLQIENTEWRRGTDGEPIAASGLRLKPRDLARIGNNDPGPRAVEREASDSGGMACGFVRTGRIDAGWTAVRVSMNQADPPMVVLRDLVLPALGIFEEQTAGWQIVFCIL